MVAQWLSVPRHRGLNPDRGENFLLLFLRDQLMIAVSVKLNNEYDSNSNNLKLINLKNYKLSPREKEILEQMLQGHSNKIIAFYRIEDNNMIRFIFS